MESFYQSHFRCSFECVWQWKKPFFLNTKFLQVQQAVSVWYLFNAFWSLIRIAYHHYKNRNNFQEDTVEWKKKMHFYGRWLKSRSLVNRERKMQIMRIAKKTKLSAQMHYKCDKRASWAYFPCQLSVLYEISSHLFFSAFVGHSSLSILHWKGTDKTEEGTKTPLKYYFKSVYNSVEDNRQWNETALDYLDWDGGKNSAKATNQKAKSWFDDQKEWKKWMMCNVQCAFRMILRCICVWHYRVMLRYNCVIFAWLLFKTKEDVPEWIVWHKSKNGINERRHAHTHTHTNALAVFSCTDKILLLCGKRKTELNEEKNVRERNVSRNEREQMRKKGEAMA